MIVLGLLMPNFGLGFFIKSLVANLAVYPAICALLITSFFFLLSAAGFVGTVLIRIIQSIADVATALPNWNPSMFQADSSSWTPPLGGADGNLLPIIFLFTSLGVMLLIPKVVEIIKSAISGKPFAYGTAIGEGLGPLAAGYALGSGFAREQAGAFGRAAYQAAGGPNWTTIAKQMGAQFRPSGTPNIPAGPTRTSSGKPRT